MEKLIRGGGTRGASFSPNGFVSATVENKEIGANAGPGAPSACVQMRVCSAENWETVTKAFNRLINQNPESSGEPGSVTTSGDGRINLPGWDNKLVHADSAAIRSFVDDTRPRNKTKTMAFKAKTESIIHARDRSSHTMSAREVMEKLRN